MDRVRQADALQAKIRALQAAAPRARLHDLQKLFEAPSGDPTFADDLESIQAEGNIPSRDPW